MNNKKLSDLLAQKPRREIVEGMHRADYFAHPGLNPSTIVQRRKSALEAKYAYEGDEEWPEDDADTPARIFGSCGHSLLFEPETFDQCWAIWNGGRRWGNEWNAFAAEARGKGQQIIAGGNGLYQFGMLQRAVRCALDKPKIRELVREGISEVAVFSDEEVMTGIRPVKVHIRDNEGEMVSECMGEQGILRHIQVKGLIDRIDTRGSNLLDAKFAREIVGPAFGRQAAELGYHLKMACYARWFQRESGKKLENVYLLTIKNSPPFDAAVVPVIDLILEDGWVQSYELICQIAQDIAAGSYPGVDGGEDLYALDLPVWALCEANREVY